MQIYKVIRSSVDKHTIDPDRGLVLQRVESMLPADDDRLVHDGETYEVQPDGTFHVPDQLGEWLTKPWDSPWKRGANPFYAETDEKPAPKLPAPRKRKVAA